MTNEIGDVSQRTAAMAGGFGYLIMLIGGIFAQFLVIQGLIVPGDAATTVVNIMAHEVLFRLGIAGWLIVLTCDVVIAWALYVFLGPVNTRLSMLTAWFRLVCTVIHGIALLSLSFVLLILSGADFLDVFQTDQLHALVMLFLGGRELGFLVALVFFGFHLCLLGCLVFKSGYMPRILGVLLVFAGLGYLTDSFAHLLLTNYATYQAIFQAIAFSTMIGELALGFWLLFNAARSRRWSKSPALNVESRV